MKFSLQFSFSSFYNLASKMFSFGMFIFGSAILTLLPHQRYHYPGSQSSGGLSDAAVFTIATYLMLWRFRKT
jgi:hypothetical protein